MGKYFKERRESMKKKILYILIVIIMLLFGICIIKIYKEKKEHALFRYFGKCYSDIIGIVPLKWYTIS